MNETPTSSIDSLRSLRSWPALLAVWTAVGAAFSLSWYLSSAAEGHAIPAALAFRWYMLDAYIWAALCPLIFFLYSYFRLKPDRLRAIVSHSGLGLAFAWLHLFFLIGLDRWLDPAFSARFHSVRRAASQLILYRSLTGVVTYSFIVAIVSADHYYGDLRRESDRRNALELQLSNARLGAL